MFKDREGKFPRKTAEEYRLEDEMLSRASERRTPIIICLDCSYSMKTERRFERVLEGLQTFCRDIQRNEIASQSVELCLITYGGVDIHTGRQIPDAVVQVDFTTPQKFRIPELRAGSATPLIDAVDTAMEAFRLRFERYADNGNGHNRPWLILIGDGDDTTGSHEERRVARLLEEETNKKALNVLCIIVGTEGKLEYNTMREMAPGRQVFYLRDLKFNDFFSWLSSSVQRTSMSASGEEVIYEPETSWAEAI